MQVKCAIELDMAPDAVDDTYAGCRDAVLEDVLESGLQAELAASPEFQAAWTAGNICEPVVPTGGRKEHGQALLAFVHGGKDFRDKFNHAVKTMGGNASFPFQSLHFLLMDAMALLQNKEKACRAVYAASPRRGAALRIGDVVRFGEFMMVSPDLSWVLEDPQVEKGFVFEITSCFVLNLQKYVCESGEENVLLSPVESFFVEDIVEVVDDDDDFDHTRVSLRHNAMASKHNCHLDPR